ncbi:carbonic anhydrase [Nocardiopsis lambiniae]|uniref:carbonic anhydrase n=1 Tax=Nocardiopsis lambiniae TaxID=3075539 RepID=A0ABU2M8Q5_9ACTN|nr:carbonic anhydrase [Nocardiopsis sp. DSM 44743]MDT0329041.1 carbonic anhydrase [Nocardiopsis sp. DSM 44743]
MAISRRHALRASLLGSAGAALATAAPASAWAEPDAPFDGGARQALRLLKEGNRRWRRFASRHPNEGRNRRIEVAQGQNPFALVLGCADSRVPPELVFDRGLGDLFTVRSAGEVLDSSVLGSVTYAVEHLEVPLIVVLGHSSCGAVSAAVDTHRTGELPHGHVGYLVEQILEVVEATPDEGGDFLDACVRANAVHVADLLRTDDELRPFVESGRLDIVPARYDLNGYGVDWL